MEVQIFGLKKSPETRKALRFFAERRIRAHFVDLDQRELAEGELRRFEQKFGLDALIDRDSRRYQELGLRHAALSPQRLFDRLLEEPALLRLPLVRRLGGSGLTVGAAEAEWKDWTTGTRAG
jgi:arsenate reductase (glutaredoxin)